MLAQVISCSNVRMIFLRHELFWFCLVQVFTTQSCCFPPVLMARIDDASDRPVPPSPEQLSPSNLDSPNGSGPDLDAMAAAQLMSSSKRFENYCYHSHGALRITKATSRPSPTLWSFVHPGLPILNRPSVPFLPRWPQNFSKSPGSSDDHRNTRRRLDTFSNTEDENVRSAVVLQFPCEQVHAGMSTWLNKFWATTNVPSFNKPIRIHCKKAPNPRGSFLEQEPSVKTFWHDTRMMVFHLRLIVPFAISAPQYWCVNPSHQKTEKLGDVLHHFRKCWFQKKQEIITGRDAKGYFIVPSVDARAQILSIYDRRNGVGKPVFKLAPPGHEQAFDIAAPNLCEPSISDVVLRQTISEASTPAQNRAANV